MSNPLILNLDRVSAILASLPDLFVFTGGATISLYVNEILSLSVPIPTNFDL
jgi:hypothetical protein